MGISFLLISAVLVSLAAGVVVAYTICVAMFAMFNSQTRQTDSRSAIQMPASSPVVD